MTQPPTAAPPPHPRGNEIIEYPPHNEEIANRVESWWDTRPCKNLFSPTSPKGGTDIIISSMIDLLHNGTKDPKKLIENTESELTYYQGKSIEIKATYLRMAYVFALEHMPLKTWGWCCERAIKMLETVGRDDVTCSQTLTKWNREFRKNRTFRSPITKKKYSPSLLDKHPEAKAIICKWAGDNLNAPLSCESLAVFVRENLAKELYEKIKDDCTLTLDEFTDSLNLTKFSVSSASRYLKHLGFRYSTRRKSYYNDKHESDENKAYRIKYINKYQEYEKDAYRWVQVPEEEAIMLENEQGLLPGVAAHYYDGMREYHVDSHPSFSERNVGLSVRRDPNVRPKVICGQDETAVKQFTFSSNCWHDMNGATTLLPKSDGLTKMLSGYVIRDTGLGIELTDEQFDAINKRRTDTDSMWNEYVSKDSALEIYGKTKKTKLTSKHALVQYFDVGMHNEGYWNYHRMALQNEDVFDVLSVVFPNCDFVLLMDQSSGHGKRRQGGLDANNMNMFWGGKKEKMRETMVPENGPHPHTHPKDEPQCMQCKATDPGPFYLSAQKRIERKYPVDTGERRIRDKTNTELLVELRQKQFEIKGHYKRPELERIATQWNIPLQIEEKVILPGWVGQNKGLLQVLYERGFVKEEEWKRYRLDCKDSQKDENGNVLEQFKPYLLRHLMAECTDFKEELSAMELLFEKLSEKGECRIELLTSPKYHCEIAGEGIEFAWGLLKKLYRSISLEKKKGKDNFEKAIEQCVRKITKEHVGRFAARSRRYMLAYMNQARQTRDGSPSLTYDGIERFVKTFKTHRNTADQDKKFIAEVWTESFL